jgi:hypothetical protein
MTFLCWIVVCDIKYFNRFDESTIEKLKLNGASPPKQNQGTNAGYQKNKIPLLAKINNL